MILCVIVVGMVLFMAIPAALGEDIKMKYYAVIVAIGLLVVCSNCTNDLVRHQQEQRRRERVVKRWNKIEADIEAAKCEYETESGEIFSVKRKASVDSAPYVIKFAKRELPEVLQMRERLEIEIKERTKKLEELKREMAQLGFSVDNDKDFDRMVAQLQEMKSASRRLWDKMVASCLAKEKYECAFSKASMAALVENTKTEGHDEADAVQRQFGNLLNEKLKKE